MAKFKVNYTETYTKTFVVEADSAEEAQEKMEYAAENISGLIDTAEDFDYWDVEVEREVSDKESEEHDELPSEEYQGW